jgi:hypothetical protein
MEDLTKADIRNIIDSPSLDQGEIISIIKNELKIEIDSDLSREEMVDEVYDAYQLALIEIESKTVDSKVKANKRANKAEKKLSKKEFIINLVKEGKYTEAEIRQVLDEEYGWHLLGKSHKTRVSRTLRELRATDKIKETADGILRYVDNT